MHDILAQSICSFRTGLKKCSKSKDQAKVEKYLVALGSMLAKCTLGQSAIDDLKIIEKLFDTTTIDDPAPFQKGFDLWSRFKTEYERFELGGMTVNERLVIMDLMDDYEVAVKSKDETTVRSILNRVYVDDESISTTIARMGDHQR